MSSSSVDPATAPAGSSAIPGVSFAVVIALSIASCGLHTLAGRSGMPVDSVWFALVGAGFLAVTAAAHVVLTRGDAVGSASLGELGPLLISMAIRLSGTFIILGLLLGLSPLGRPEAVLNVLFWYITLTATDLIGLVRDRRRREHASAAGQTVPLGGSESR